MSHSPLCLLVIGAVLGVACEARRLRAHEEVSEIAEQSLPIQLGDGTEPIISSASLRRQGGTLKAIGRKGLSRLRASAGWHGTLMELAQVIDNDDDLVGA